MEEVNYEIKLLASYLPAAVSEEEIKVAAQKAVQSLGSNFGMVMKDVMTQFKGRADGAIVSKIVKEVIGA